MSAENFCSNDDEDNAIANNNIIIIITIKFLSFHSVLQGPTIYQFSGCTSQGGSLCG
jgi:hypothetical protein